MPKKIQLVCQHLENISGDVLEDYQDIIREYVSRRQGVYALYHDDDLYYVGLASDLRTRLKAHLGDKHGGQWNRFSVYLTIGDKHLRELEALILRVVKPRPEGNSKSGKFARSENLLARLAKDIRRRDREKLDHIVGRTEETIRVVLPGRMPPLCPYVKKVFKLRGRSKGKTFYASVKDDGTIRLKGKVYSSPSAAAVAVTKYPVDGWSFWKYERAPGDWVRLDELRK
jgi:RAMA domain-containing protein